MFLKTINELIYTKTGHIMVRVTKGRTLIGASPVGLSLNL